MAETWTGNNKIFKGYFHGQEKKPTEKVKNQAGHTWDEVCADESFGAVLNTGYIDVSFDSKDMYTAFLNMADGNNWRCLALPSTHGGHTYWRMPAGRHFTSGADKKVAVGLVADFHRGATYIPLRVDGADRFPPDYDILPGEDYQELPEELYPVTTASNLWKLADHDGRNTELFRYILVLQGEGLAVDTIRRILSNANRFVFADPLTDKELETVLRDEAFEKPTFYGGKSGTVFMFDKFAEYLKAQHHIISVNGSLCVPAGNIYRSDSKAIERLIIQAIPHVKDSERREVLKYLQLICEDTEQAPAEYIAFKNGVYDLTADSLQEFSPEYVLLNQIPWNYNRDAYSELADKTLNKLAAGDESIRMLLEECIGYCFYRANIFKKAFMLTGDGNNGKSTFLGSMIMPLLGTDNVSALDLSEIGERFSTVMIFGKLANIGDDISDDFLQGKQVSIFKQITDGGRLKAEQKGMQPFEFNPYCKLIFSANDIPRMKDDSGAARKRLVIVPFNAVFSDKDADYDPAIRYKLKEQTVMEYLAVVGVQGLQRLLSQGHFTRSGQVDTAMQQYELENNPVKAFLAEIPAYEINNQPVSRVYAKYKYFCEQNKYLAKGKGEFSKDMRRSGRYISDPNGHVLIDGRRTTCSVYRLAK